MTIIMVAGTGAGKKGEHDAGTEAKDSHIETTATAERELGKDGKGFGHLKAQLQ